MNDPIKGTARGCAPAPLSVLDTVLAGRGISAADALSGSIALAELAERRGFTRYWVTEHHSMPGVSSSSPAVLLARLTAHTTRLRLGAGGVMLPNHPPLIVAEQYGLLQALAPDRIDLGLGRAPGTNQATAAALRRGRSDDDDFPQQLVELLRFLGDDFPEEHPYRERVYAVPGPGQDKENGLSQTTGRPSVCCWDPPDTPPSSPPAWACPSPSPRTSLPTTSPPPSSSTATGSPPQQSRPSRTHWPASPSWPPTTSTRPCARHAATPTA
ncbi:hypothetical protein HDC93_006748 [Streptomyces sp. AK010]|nr:hypothetical protein [Streptomyces sp. AK010]